MKRWLIYIALLAAALAFPKQPVELGKLIPVELIMVERLDGQYRIRTDTGDAGQGATLETAIQNLHDNASGHLFLDTAQYLLLMEETRDAIPAISSLLKGNTRVCLVKYDTKLDDLARYLSAHPPQVRLKDLKIGEKPEYLQQIETK